MDFKIVKTKTPKLSKYIDYFLFIESHEGKQVDSYTTLPNTNLCLSLYKQNEVHWDQENNHCQIQESQRFGLSRMYAWHRKPFEVKLSGHMDQVCILFKPLGLAHFSHIPLNRVDKNDDPFTQLFGLPSLHVAHQVFETSDKAKRAEILENFLLKHFRSRETSIVDLCLGEIQSQHAFTPFCIHTFCTSHKIHESTLYRKFRASLGESVKNFQLKHRFRSFLKQLKHRESFTDLSYAMNYYDQSHLIKEVRKYTGYSPRSLAAKIRMIDQELLLLG